MRRLRSLLWKKSTALTTGASTRSCRRKTILSEPGNCHLYEKMGYHQTGKVEHINDRMDIVFYEKG